MGIFGANEKSIKESERKARLKRLEDKRLKFAADMAARGVKPDDAVYIQREGGFWGLMTLGEQRALVYGPGPMDDADFSIEFFMPGDYAVEKTEAVVQSKGMGGAFGFGTRGGRGFTLTIKRPDETSVEITLLSDIGSFMACKDGGALLKLKRNRGDANFCWDFRTRPVNEVLRLGEKWLALLSGNGG